MRCELSDLQEVEAERLDLRQDAVQRRPVQQSGSCRTGQAALPHFITEIDGLDIQFIHVRSRHENALPVIITHGWPGSVIELLAVIDPLTNPTAHGGSAADAFDVMIPSILGYGYSGKPRQTGPDRVDEPAERVAFGPPVHQPRHSARG